MFSLGGQYIIKITSNCVLWFYFSLMRDYKTVWEGYLRPENSCYFGIDFCIFSVCDVSLSPSATHLQGLGTWLWTRVKMAISLCLDFSLAFRIVDDLEIWGLLYKHLGPSYHWEVLLTPTLCLSWPLGLLQCEKLAGWCMSLHDL